MQKLSALLDFKKAAKAAAIALPLTLGGCATLNVSTSGEVTGGEWIATGVGIGLGVLATVVIEGIQNNQQAAPAPAYSNNNTGHWFAYPNGRGQFSLQWQNGPVDKCQVVGTYKNQPAYGYCRIS